jgi:peptide/nickel transport system substrate-binding protein
MAHNLLSDLALPGESMISRASESYDPNARWYDYNPEKAKALLAEAGAAGTKLVFATSTSGSGQILPVQMGEWIQQNLNSVGFQCELKTYEWVSYTNDFFTGMKPEWDLAQMSWGMTTDYWLTVFLHPNSSYNVSHVKVPELGELIDKGHQSPDPTVARDLYRKAAELAKEEAWWIPVVCDLAPVVMSPKVKGFAHTADWQLGYFGNVWLES